jgi:hypothetical protein
VNEYFERSCRTSVNPDESGMGHPAGYRELSEVIQVPSGILAQTAFEP